MLNLLGSKYPNIRALGPKYRFNFSIWDLLCCYWGTETVRERLIEICGINEASAVARSWRLVQQDLPWGLIRKCSYVVPFGFVMVSGQRNCNIASKKELGSRLWVHNCSVRPKNAGYNCCRCYCDCEYVFISRVINCPKNSLNPETCF